MDGQAIIDPFSDDGMNEALSAFKPKPAAKPSAPEMRATERAVKAADRAAADQGFSSRKRLKPKRRRSKFYETGRSTQIAIKGKEEDKVRLNAMCDKQDWVQGQLLQYALDALAEKIADPKSNFWADRNFNGVE
jgi:hypothetical protein